MLLILLACAAKDGGAIDSAVDSPPLPGGVALGEVQLCEVPLAESAYVEVGEAWGLQDQRGDDPNHEEGPSLAAGDLDGDGQLDLAIFMELGDSALYLNRGDHFELRPAGAPGVSAVFLDADGDGDSDIAVGGADPYLLINDQSQEFPIEPLDALRYAPAASYVHDLSPGDLDGDGVIDLYAAASYDFLESGEPAGDRVLSLSDRAVVDGAVAEDIGGRHSFDALWFDEDRDGDLDVYIANDLGMNYGASGLLRNQGGALVDATGDCFCEVLTAAKGVDIGDFNRDGRPDLYIPGTPLITLLSQASDGAWVDVSATSGASQLYPGATGWGGGFLDYDNDGYPDLLSAQGDRWNEGNDNPHVDVPLQLLHQQGGVFTDAAASMGLDVSGSFRAAMALDLNGDGVQDLLISQMDGRPYLFLSQGCTAAGWLQVEAPLGSVVSVSAGGAVQTDWARADAGYLATRPNTLHFGLGSAQVVDGLTVTLPGGRIIEVEGPIEARRRITVSGE